MKYLFFLLVFSFLGCESISTSEQSIEAFTCKEMIGTWFTDTTVENVSDGKKRDIIRIDRKADGTAYLKGVSIYYETGEVSNWEFPSKWFCKNQWYIEENEWGKTKFKIKEFKTDRTILYDEKNNMNAEKPIEIIETRDLKNISDLPIARQVVEYLGS